MLARKAARQVRQGAGLCAGCLQSDGQDGSAAAAAALLESVGRLLPASSEAGLWDDMNEVGLALKALA